MVTIAPFCAPQRLLGRAGQEECRGQVDVDHAAPFVERQLPDRLALHDAGIGDHGVEPAEPFEQHVDRLDGGRGIGDVAFHRDRGAAAARKHAREPALLHVERADRPALVFEMPRDGAADPMRRARHQDDRPDRFRASMLSALWHLVSARSARRCARPFRPRSRHRGFRRLPMASSASQRIAAVTPEPQLVITGLSRSTPLAANLRDPLRRDQAAVLDQPGGGHVDGARHMAGMQARPRLRRFAAEAFRRPRVDDLRALLCRARPARRRGRRPRRRRNRAWKCRGGRTTSPLSIGRPSAFHFGKPPSRMKTSRTPNTRNVHHTRGAANRPAPSRPRPSSRRRCRARASPRRKPSGFGSMWGSAVVWSAILSMSKNTAPGIWARDIRRALALHRRQIEGAVHHRDVGRVQMGLQPFGRNEVAARGCGHGGGSGFCLHHIGHAGRPRNPGLSGNRDGIPPRNGLFGRAGCPPDGLSLALLRLDPGLHHHVAPLHGFGLDEIGVVLRARREIDLEAERV